MNKVSFVTFVCLGLIQGLLNDVRAQSSEELVNLMSEANKTRNYEGTFIFSRGDDLDVMRILHKKDDGGELEKITSLTGHAREIIRNNDTVTCIFPDKQQVMVERSRAQTFPGKLPEVDGPLVDYYEFSTLGNERIAGRDAWVVRILPRDKFRYGYQLWIDKENHLLLKSEMHDDEGNALEQLMFTEIELRDVIDDNLFKPSVTGKEYTRYQYTEEASETKNVDQAGQSNWRVTWMPAGFSLSIYDGNSRSENNASLEHMIYSDGISTVSIFIERLANDSPANTGSMNIGGVNVYSRETNGFQVTAVGEVPQPTVRRMVESVVGVR